MYVDKLDEVNTVQGLDPKRPIRLFAVDANGNEIYLGRHEDVTSLKICQETLITQTEFESKQKKAELETQLKALESK